MDVIWYSEFGIAKQHIKKMCLNKPNIKVRFG